MHEVLAYTSDFLLRTTPAFVASAWSAVLISGNEACKETYANFTLIRVSAVKKKIKDGLMKQNHRRELTLLELPQSPSSVPAHGIVFSGHVARARKPPFVFLNYFCEPYVRT